MTAWTAERIPAKDHLRLVRPYCNPPLGDGGPLDALHHEFGEYDVGYAGGIYWAFRLNDPRTLVWGLTPGSLADAIRARSWHPGEAHWSTR